MRAFSVNIKFCLYAILFAAVCLSTASLAQEKDKEKSKDKDKVRTQHEFCSENNNWDDNVSAKDLRETTIPAPGLLDVDGGRNGGMRIKGSDRADILIRACVQAWGKTMDEAKASVAAVKVQTGPSVRAAGPGENTNWSVQYEILVPRSTNLKLVSNNGGISIDSVEGNIDFSARNGGIHLNDVAGAVKGRTQNGGVNVNLSGGSWKGSGLDVETTNGGVHLSMPQNYAARVEAGTVNGGFHSDINGLNIEKTSAKGDQRWNWSRNQKVNTSINGGGAPIRVVTTNGGVSINASN